jgi:hypothetical protein
MNNDLTTIICSASLTFVIGVLFIKPEYFDHLTKTNMYLIVTILLIIAGSCLIGLRFLDYQDLKHSRSKIL